MKARDIFGGARVPYWIAGIVVAMIGGATLLGRLA